MTHRILLYWLGAAEESRAGNKGGRALEQARLEHETKVTARAALNSGESALKLCAEQLESSRLERLRWDQRNATFDKLSVVLTS